MNGNVGLSCGGNNEEIAFSATGMVGMNAQPLGGQVYQINPQLEIVSVSNTRCLIDPNTRQCTFLEDAVANIRITGVSEELNINISNVEYSLANNTGSAVCSQTTNDREYDCNIDLSVADIGTTGTHSIDLTIELDATVSDDYNQQWGPFHLTDSTSSGGGTNNGVQINATANIVTIGALEVKLVEVTPGSSQDPIECTVFKDNENDDLRCIFTGSEKPELHFIINGLENVDDQRDIVDEVVYYFDGYSSDEVQITPEGDNGFVITFEPEDLDNDEELSNSGGSLEKDLRVTGSISYAILGEPGTYTLDETTKLHIDVKALTDDEADAVNSTTEATINSIESSLAEIDKKIEKTTRLLMIVWAFVGVLIVITYLCCKPPTCHSCKVLIWVTACAIALASILSVLLSTKLKKYRDKKKELYEQYSQLCQTTGVGCEDLPDPNEDKKSIFENVVVQIALGILGIIATIVCFSGTGAGSGASAGAHAAEEGKSIGDVFSEMFKRLLKMF